MKRRQLDSGQAVMAKDENYCKPCSNHLHEEVCSKCDGNSEYDELWEADDSCRHEIVSAAGGWIRCTKCTGWFCY